MKLKVDKKYRVKINLFCWKIIIWSIELFCFFLEREKRERGDREKNVLGVYVFIYYLRFNYN